MPLKPAFSPIWLAKHGKPMKKLIFIHVMIYFFFFAGQTQDFWCVGPSRWTPQRRRRALGDAPTPVPSARRYDRKLGWKLVGVHHDHHGFTNKHDGIYMDL